MNREVSSDPFNVIAREKRATRREDGHCVNGSTSATHGCRCFRCYLTHRHGVAKARQMPEYHAAPVCNPR